MHMYQVADTVALKEGHAGLPAGTRGVIVDVYGPVAVEVEFVDHRGRPLLESVTTSVPAALVRYFVTQPSLSYGTIPITYQPKFIAAPDADFTALQSELAWVRRDATPRLEYYVNRENLPYAYGSGGFSRTYQAQPSHAVIDRIEDQLLILTGHKFEICFLNRYLNQSDHLGWHADDSPEIDPARPIAIVSLGVEREIWFKCKDGTDVEKVKLEHGSLCLMAPGMQQTHRHRIPKAGFLCGERISLTYRGLNKVQVP